LIWIIDGRDWRGQKPCHSSKEEYPMLPLPTFRAVLAPLALALAIGACGSKPADPVIVDESGAPSTEFVAENPTDPATPVDLPSTAMTNVPVGEASPAKKD
jgi:hypothetical protein